MKLPFWAMPKKPAFKLHGGQKHNCIDNMQRDHGGPVGLYGCHGLTTQRWRLMKDGVVSNGVSCIQHTVLGSGSCSTAQSWEARSDGSVRIAVLPNSCLTASNDEHADLKQCQSPLQPVSV